MVQPFRVGFSDTIDLVFLIAAGVVAIGFFVLLFLPQLALSNKSGIQARQEADGGRPTATGDRGDAGEQAEQSVQAVGAAAPTSTAPPSGRRRTRTADAPGSLIPRGSPWTTTTRAAGRIGRAPGSSRHTTS